MASSLDVMAGYVPALVFRHLADEAATPPFDETVAAAVLVARMTGITTFSEQLSDQSEVSAEQTAMLNGCFEQLVALVHRYGGDVVYLAGDTVLAVFVAPDEPTERQPTPPPHDERSLQAATLRAAHGGIEAQNTLNEFELAPGLPLQLHVGIGAGSVTVAHVGGVDGHWELLVIGEPLQQVSRANHLAQPGQIVLSPEAWQIIQERARGEEIASGYVDLQGLKPIPTRPLTVPTLEPSMESVLRAYVPATVLSRLDAGHSRWLAEWRRVAVLSVYVPDLTEQTPLEQAQAMFQAIQWAVTRAEGAMLRLESDERGTTVLAAFGMPPRSLDDSIQVVHAALELCDSLVRLGVQSAVGLASGQAFCGDVGSSTRYSYTVIGSPVNLAVRLMQAARDSLQETAIVCDEATCQGARSSILFDELPPLTLTEKPSPLLVYRPLRKIGQAPDLASDTPQPTEEPPVPAPPSPPLSTPPPGEEKERHPPSATTTAMRPVIAVRRSSQPLPFSVLFWFSLNRITSRFREP